jgi:hypothetical protein
VLKPCVDKDGVDYCYAESQLKEVNKQRRLRKDTNELTEDRAASIEIAKALTEIKKTADDLSTEEKFITAMTKQMLARSAYENCSLLTYYHATPNKINTSAKEIGALGTNYDIT